MPKVRKKTSKRVTLRKKYSVTGKVREHHRKIKKEARVLKKGGMTPKRSKKSPGIPNLFPEKEKMLDDLERKQTLQNETEKLRKMADKSLPDGTVQGLIEDIAGKVTKPVEDKLIGGLTEQELNAADTLMHETGELASKQQGQSRRAYIKELKKVIEVADVVVQVLDSRDPQGSRNNELEQSVLKQDKKMLLIINKTDLVPAANARAWQKLLTKEFPCILLTANEKINSSKMATSTTIFKKSMTEKEAMASKQTSSVTGAEKLQKILFSYSKKTEKKITVAIVGFPNVGKSSIINSLKGARATAVGNTPGVTKSMQEINLNKAIVLVDSPGIISTDDQADSSILRAASRMEEENEDSIKPVESLINCIEKSELLKFYRIGNFTNTDEFLAQVAKKRGMLGTDGVANMDAVARVVIRDFMYGKIACFTKLPENEDISETEHDDVIML